MERTRSIRTQLFLYLFLAIGVSVSVTVLSSITVSGVISDSSRYFSCSRVLGEFYDTVGDMDTAARAYIYSQKETDYASYQTLLKKAEDSLSDCQAAVSGDTAWRITRLGKMLEYYQQPLIGYLDGHGSQYETYMLLQYRSRLITATASTFYVYLADYMAEQTQQAQRSWTRQQVLVLTALGGVLLIGVFLGIFCSRSIYRPIRVIVENTERLKAGTYKLQPVEHAARELQVLQNAFLDMAVQIEHNFVMLKENARLERELLQKENENLVMKNLVTEADLRNLQSQINPHFLFNTMSMISQSAYINGDVQTSELMEKLTSFLRYALDKANKSSSLKEELDSIRNYLFIQQRRFGDRVRFDLDIEEQIPDIRMPAVILQPLVENAILHGVGSMTSSAVILIEARTSNDRLLLHIEDNGSGMTSEQLEELQMSLHLGLERQGGKDARPSIGLCNVYRRLQAFYGNDLRFSIDSEVGCGTVISISLPMEGCA